jgi:hypothetical protein
MYTALGAETLQIMDPIPRMPQLKDQHKDFMGKLATSCVKDGNS